MSNSMREAFEEKIRVGSNFYLEEASIYVPGDDSIAGAGGEAARLNEDWGVWQICWQAALQSQQPESEPVYQVWFSKGQWTDVPKKVYDKAVGTDRARILYTGPQPSPQVPEGLRLEVLAFAQLMQFKLDKNRHKDGEGWPRDASGARNGWRGCDPKFLMAKLDEEVAELQIALNIGTSEQVHHEAADVGNIAMMLADITSPIAAPSIAENPPVSGGD